MYTNKQSAVKGTKKNSHSENTIEQACQNKCVLVTGNVKYYPKIIKLYLIPMVLEAK